MTGKGEAQKAFIQEALAKGRRVILCEYVDGKSRQQLITEKSGFTQDLICEDDK